MSSLAGIVALVAGLLGPIANDLSPPVPGRAAQRAESHRRMLTELQAVHERAQRSNRYLGREPLELLQAQLAALPPGAEGPRGVGIRQAIAREQLRLGETEEALGLLREARDLARGLPDKIQAEVLFDLGTSALRLGEDQNCCANNHPESCILPIREGGQHRRREGSEEAIACFEGVLERVKPKSPLGRKARWLLNLAHMTLGTYPDGLPKGVRIDPGVFASDEDFPRFSEIAGRAGLDERGLAGGMVAEDFDGDGDLDLMLSSSATDGQLKYYENDGRGSFEDATERAGLTGLWGGLNLVSGDYDGDGWIDVLVLRGAWWASEGKHINSLIRNEGGFFVDVTFEAGLGDSRYPTQTAAFCDYDKDGDLDLFVGNESQPDHPAPSELFENDGQGHFVDVASSSGVTNDRYTKGVTWGDYDGDGDADLYVSNMGADNRLYRNDGNGRFQDVAGDLGVVRPRSGFPTWFFDFDNDGDLDLFAASYGGANSPPDVAFVASSYLGLKHRGESLCLYVNDGQGGFEERSRELGLDLYNLPMGANFGDVDGDGFLDLYLGTGYPYYEGLMPNLLLRNRGGAGFSDVTTNSGMGHLQKGHGVAFADLDRDGDADVVARMGGAYPGDAYRCVLFENPGFGHRWLRVVLQGTQSNRWGVGASLRVDVRLSNSDEVRSIHRTVGTGGSFGCNPHVQEIGLGTAESIERVVVRWPASGLVQEIAGPELDSLLRIQEPAIGAGAVSEPSPGEDELPTPNEEDIIGP